MTDTDIKERMVIQISTYINEAGYTELIRQILSKKDTEDLETLRDAISSFHDYVDTVIKGELSVTLMADEDVQTYQERISTYDRNRHTKHETAIISCRVLNRLAEKYGIQPVYMGGEDRKQVAAFCLEVDQYIFSNRRIVL